LINNALLFASPFWFAKTSPLVQGTGKEVEVMRLHVPRALQPLAGPVANPGALGVLGVAFAIKEPWLP